MLAVAYYRAVPDPAVAEAELAVQRRSVETWVAEHGAAIIAEFTETEGEGRARPVFGAARRRAAEAGAVTLVATDKPIGPRGAFHPSSPYRGPQIVVIEDPAAIERRAWAQTSRVVVYLRDPDGDAKLTAVSLAQQEAAIADAVRCSRYTVLATFTEPEGGTPPSAGAGQPDDADPARPELARALALCRAERARLLVGTDLRLRAGGQPLDLAGIDVPHIIGFRPEPVWPERIDCPSDLPAPVALQFGTVWHGNRRALYLANGTGADLHDVVATRAGWTLGFGDLTVLPTHTVRIAKLAAGIGVRVDTHDLMFDADFVLSWRVTAATADGRRWQGTLTLPKGDPRNRQLGLRDWAPLPPDADAAASDRPADS
ncbi:recombinase family protein [Aureimonas leprariae]|uniref:Recombinase family protein n=1 Tax=Plantimonas leprariae TaxID=2615207 RepID=A0A7V7PLI2_9HYPH|nr:recombinase family protein [Aureimonas leprariae]KAB0677234.1 recombinase family protein [Aureimonas leprariae]